MATNKEIKINGVMTPVTDFSHTSQEIDDATTRALGGGAIDQLLAGKAPAGYGIGEENAARVNDTDLDALKKGGTYYIGTGCTNTPPNTDPSWSTLHVIPGRACTQIFIPANDANRAGTFSSWIARIYNDKTAAWGEWEWVNPPMALGVEYRTTERYDGKVVTRKLVNCGAIANAKTVQLADNSKYRIISANVRLGSDPMPYWHNGAVGTGNTTNVWNAYFNIVTTSITLYCGSSAAEAAQTVSAEVRMIPA